MFRTNETRHIKWHEASKFECRLDSSVCNNKQRWNDDKCRCECKELIEYRPLLIKKGVCDKGSIWNPSNCECECDKSCDVGKYLDYENCKSRKKLVDKLIEECTQIVEEVKLARITSAESRCGCSSCTLYTVLFSIIFTVNIGVGSYFLYFHWNLKNDLTRAEFGTRTQNNNLIIKPIKWLQTLKT